MTSAPLETTVRALLSRLARAQHARPLPIVLAAFALAAVAVPWVLELELDSDFQAVLPESAQSVRDLDEIRARVGGTATIALAVRSERGDREAVHAFVRALAPRLEARTDAQIVSVDWSVADFEELVSQNAYLYAPHADLLELRDALRARIAWERERATPFWIDLGEEPPADPRVVIDRMRARADEARARFPDGFYEHPREPLDLVFVRTSIRGGEVGATERLIAAIEETATEIAGRPARATRTAGTDVGWAGDGIRIDYGGELMDILEENAALAEAVARSTAITLVLLLASIWIFFRRFRAVPLLGLALVPPTIVTFGIAENVVDTLNASSAFLASIVVGNGVNASIMWLGRYFEERRERHDVAAAIERAHHGTWSGTLAAALAAALAYGSLTVTDHRGFRDFGFIGALGMLLCWVAAYALLPALAALSERFAPMRFDDRDRARKGVYGLLFARIAIGSPRAVLAGCAALSIVSVVAIASAARGDVLEYDFRNLQAERSAESRVAWVNDRLAETVEETRAGGALAVLAARPEEVPSLRAQLERFAAAHPGDLGAVRTIDDLLPREQRANLAVIEDLRALALEVRPHLSEEQARELDAAMPPETIALLGPDDLPESAARPFTERDGTRGRLLFVEHAAGEDTWNGRYMIRWAAAVRSARSADGSAPPVGGGAAVFADLLTAMFREGPLAIGVSFLFTIALVAITFRRRRDRALALGSMLVGVLWMTGALWICDVRLNFLNMVAFPITFGIGVEYGVNFVKRFAEERERCGEARLAARAALEGAGGAVILCSLTTLIGYVSLYTSANRALNSFGLAMSIGEITCLAASLLALPALLHLVDRAPATARTTAEAKEVLA